MAVPEGEARAAEALERATTMPELLRATAVALVELLDASACSISRVLGDALVIVTEHAPGARGCSSARATSSPTSRSRRRW